MLKLKVKRSCETRTAKVIDFMVLRQKYLVICRKVVKGSKSVCLVNLVALSLCSEKFVGCVGEFGASQQNAC